MQVISFVFAGIAAIFLILKAVSVVAARRNARRTLQSALASELASNERASRNRRERTSTPGQQNAESGTDAGVARVNEAEEEEALPVYTKNDPVLPAYVDVTRPEPAYSPNNDRMV